MSGILVLLGESLRRNLAAALILQLQPRNSAETLLLQTMIAARWRLLRTWGLNRSGTVLAAVAFRSLAGSSRVLRTPIRPSSLHAPELREIPDPGPSSGRPVQLATETWDDDSKIEAKLKLWNVLPHEGVRLLFATLQRLETNPICGGNPTCVGAKRLAAAAPQKQATRGRSTAESIELILSA